MVRQIKRKHRSKGASNTKKKNGLSSHLLRCVLSVLLVVGLIGGLTLMAGTPSKNLVDHNSTINPRYSMFLEQAKPRIILLGNSMLGESVDDQLFMNQVQQRTIKLWGGGWSSAMWYLAFKNVIVPASPGPRTVVVFFRDHFLTAPAFRVTGEYKKVVEQLSEPQEPLLERLAYLGAMSPMEYWINQNWSLVQKRNSIKHGLESNVKSWIGSAYGHPDVQSVNQSIEELFETKDLLADELGKAQLKSESVTKGTLYDFEKSLPVSFLPAMVEMARKNDIQLILVRVKRRRETEGLPTPAGLDEYIRDLKQWCNKEQVPLIDFSQDTRLTLNHYADGDHLNRAEGRTLFTQLLAEELKPYLNTTTASR